MVKWSVVLDISCMSRVQILWVAKYFALGLPWIGLDTLWNSEVKKQRMDWSYGSYISKDGSIQWTSVPEYRTFATQNHSTCPWFYCLFYDSIWSVNSSIRQLLMLTKGFHYCLACLAAILVSSVDKNIKIMVKVWVSIPGMWILLIILFSSTQCITVIAVRYVHSATRLLV